MSREIRMVHADWEHPKEYNPYRQQDEYKPLYGGDWSSEAAEWDAEREAWERGEKPEFCSIDPSAMPYDEYAGRRPYSEDYMPQWSDDEKTHVMMYETCSEGTPISPAFETPEEVARWCADNGASSFAGQTASYEGWLKVARGTSSISMVMQGGVITNGVDAQL